METPNPQSESKPEYNADTAVLIKDLIVCVARTEKGPAIMSSFQNRLEASQIMLNINIEIVDKIKEFDRAKNRIVLAKGGIINAVRNRIVGR